MKKIVALLLCGVMLFSFAACSDKVGDDGEDTDVAVTKANEPLKLSGKKEAVEVLVGFYENGAIERKYEYDANGNMILDINYKDNGTAEGDIETWLYDENNKLLKESYCDVYNGGEPVEYTYSYDKDGFLYLKTANSGSYTEYKNDKNGFCTEEQNYLADGTKGSKTLYEYDNRGNRTLRAIYKADGSLDYEYRYEYDEAGNVKVEICSRSDGTESKTLREYNTDGKLLKYERFDNGVRIRDYGYEYDENGSMTKYYEYIYGESTVENTDIHYINDDNGARKRYDKYVCGCLDEYCTYESDARGRTISFTRFNSNSEFIYAEEISYTDSGLRLRREIIRPDKTETADYEYMTIEVPVELADQVRAFQAEYDP